MQLLCESATKQAYESLYGEAAKSFAGPSFGEGIPLEVALIQKLNRPDNERIFDPQDLTGWIIRAAIGKSFQLPVAGTFTITYDGDETTDLAYNATAAEINTAFNALASVTADGGAVVTGENGYFFFTWNVAGDRDEISGDPTNLAPLSITETGVLISGDAGAGRREVQTLRLIQNPGAYAVLGATAGVPGAFVDTLQTGGGGFNHEIRVRLEPFPYDGRWTILVESVESGLLAHNISEADLITALEAISTVGTGNVGVYKEQEGRYIIMFQGALANTPIGGISVTAGALKIMDMRIGTLDLRTAGIELLLNGEASFDGTFEIEGTPPSGYPVKIFQQPVKVVSAVIDPASLTPQPGVQFYTKEEIDLMFLGPKWRRKTSTGDLQFKGTTSGLFYTVQIDDSGGIPVWAIDPTGEA